MAQTTLNFAVKETADIPSTGGDNTNSSGDSNNTKDTNILKTITIFSRRLINIL